MIFVKPPGPQGLSRDLVTPGGHPLKEVELATLPVDGDAWQLVVEVMTPERPEADGRVWNMFTPVAVIDINRLVCADKRVGYPVILRLSATVHDDKPETAGSVMPQAVAPVQDLTRT